MKTRQELKIGIVTARFNSIITSRLREGARDYLTRQGVGKIVEVAVPGSFEAPLAARALLEREGVDGVVCLGAVVRGSTQHFDYVCSSSSSGLMSVQLETGRPVGFGILTCDTLEQGFDRAGGKLGNKGEEASATVLEMIETLAGLGVVHQ